MANLPGKVIMVTGSSSGIGASCALACAREGAKVILTGRDEKRLTEVVRSCLNYTSSDCVHSIVGDLTDDDVVTELITSTINRFGRIDGMVMCAGYAIPRDTEQSTLADMRVLWKLHIVAPFMMIKLANKYLEDKARDELPDMTSSGSHLGVAKHPQFARFRVIFISSLTGFYPMSMTLGYSVSKAEQDHFVRLLSNEFSASVLQANSVRPGAVRTPVVKNSGVIGGDITASVVFAAMDMLTPIGRCGTSEEVAEYVAFALRSHQHPVVNGQNLLIDGGEALPYCYNPRCAIL